MRLSASCSLVLLGTGLLFAAQPPAGPRTPVPSAPKAAAPQFDDPSLPPPRSLPRPMPSQPIIEEPAPAPHERPSGTLPLVPPGRFREEPAPMPREQSPMPARFFMPGGPQDSSVPDVETLHREIEKLKLEREALLVEEMDLITARDLRNSKTATANLRKRLTELVAKVAQQAKRERETAASAPPVRPQAEHGNGATAPSVRSYAERGNETHSPSPSTSGGASVSPSPTSPGRVPPQPPPSPAIQTPTKHPEITPHTVTDEPVDDLALAQLLYQARDYAAALGAYRKIDLEQQKPEDRVAIQYLMACCLRKLGKTDEASVLYREVANTTGDNFLAENAQWHLRAMKERQELEGQLAELRQRRQAVMPRKP